MKQGLLKTEKIVGNTKGKKPVTWTTLEGEEITINMDERVVESFEKYAIDKNSINKTSKFEATSHGAEIIGPKVQTFEQARNIAQQMIGDLGIDAKPLIGTLKKSAGYGKIVGRVSADGKVRWRIDWDSIKGPHIHVEDVRVGKKFKSQNYVIPFEGTEDIFIALLKYLNR